VSYTSVHRIMNDKRPCKSNRPKERAKILDDIIPCFRKRFDLSQIITPIIDNRHLVLQNSSNITYFFISKRPCKSNRPKERAKILDDFDHCVIKRTIHGLYSWKIAPTVSIIHKEIKDSLKISKSKLTLTPPKL
jgi:hypothetical protein